MNSGRENSGAMSEAGSRGPSNSRPWQSRRRNFCKFMQGVVSNWGAPNNSP
ncbi:hypothetical protein D3C81_2107310 [compost metagenome]